MQSIQLSSSSVSISVKADVPAVCWSEVFRCIFTSVLKTAKLPGNGRPSRFSLTSHRAMIRETSRTLQASVSTLHVKVHDSWTIIHNMHWGPDNFFIISWYELTEGALSSVLYWNHLCIVVPIIPHRSTNRTLAVGCLDSQFGLVLPYPTHAWLDWDLGELSGLLGLLLDFLGAPCPPGGARCSLVQQWKRNLNEFLNGRLIQAPGWSLESGFHSKPCANFYHVDGLE